MRVHLAACLVLFGGAAFCFAQIPGADSVKGPNAKMPAMREGLVLSVRWYAMSHAGHATDFKEDENGGWVGTDGTKLSASEHGSTSAGGVSQTVVSCLDGDQVFLATHNYTDMQLFRLPDPVSNGPAATFAVKIDGCDLWMAPGRLAQMQSDPATHLVVQPVQWKMGNQTCAAIRVTKVQPDQYIDHVFDSATGICLHAAESSTSAAPQLKYLAPGETVAGDTQLYAFDLINVRDANTPWANEPAPSWVGELKDLHYTGQSQAANRFVQPVPTQIGLDISRVDSGGGWLSVSTHGFVVARGQPLYGAKGIYLTGHDQFDGFFAGPVALAKLHAGQVLDSDPVTHIQTSVQRVDGNSVTIITANRSGQATRTFDMQSGRLTAFTSFTQLTKITTSFQLLGQ